MKEEPGTSGRGWRHGRGPGAVNRGSSGFYRNLCFRDSGQAMICGGEAMICGGEAKVCGGQVMICGGQAKACGGQAMICGGEVMIPGGEAKVCGREALIRGGEAMVCGRRAKVCGGGALICDGNGKLRAGLGPGGCKKCCQCECHENGFLGARRWRVIFLYAIPGVSLQNFLK